MEQKELVKIFKKIKKLIKKYEKPLKPKFNLDSKYDLWSFKDVTIAGRERKEVYFVGLIIQSSYVGFYYMPVYAEQELKKFFKPELLSLLKGKSCFHIKELNPKLEKQIEQALKKGYQLYKKKDGYNYRLFKTISR